MGYWRKPEDFNNKEKKMDLSALLNGVTAQEDQQEKKALPAGRYNVAIEKVEGKTNPSTGAKGVSVQMRVYGEKFNNYVVFDYMMISGNEKALEYSLPKLKKLATVLGSENSAQWTGKKVAVSLGVDKKDESRNIVWGYGEASEQDQTSSNQSSNSFETGEIPF